MKVTGYGHSVIGGREMNQDSFLVDNSLNLYAVADGVGGGLRGEEASKMAVEGLRSEYKPHDLLKPVIEKLAARVLMEALQSCNGQALMGTTLTAVQVTDNLLHLCHVGDSRAYLFDGSALRQLTEDHEFFDENVNGPVLASYLGLDTRVHPLTVLEETIEVQAGQRVLLCSDGLYKQISEVQIVEMIHQHGQEPQKLLEVLCAEAAKAEYSDNITIVYLVLEAN
ncbi:MAG: serine/threonine-protein phosphatase [Proteobacteria bacterium]|nr:serine/threonine-protein phosphatase [Pseudomonadota bacterium]NDG27617.1 serine/threonine-protein phosphatase [Pseudomonadota bacterium]